MRLIFLLGCFLIPIFAFNQTTYLYCGRLLTMANGEPNEITEATVIIEGNRIAKVQRGYAAAPVGAETVDLKAYSVLPGLIDCHVHLESQQNRQSYLEDFTLNEADIAYNSLAYARRTLAAGFTTVRDLGGSGVNIALRNAIKQGKVVGPRIVTAGKALSITGGHGDPTNGGHLHLYDPPLPMHGVADGPDECRKAVREQIQHGADLIKVCATGGVLSLARDGKLPHYATDELETIVRTARDLGADVAAHAHGDEGARRAIEAGVASIEHGTFMSDATLELMKQKGTWYVPTLTAGWAVSDSAQRAAGFFPEVVRTKALGIGPKIEETLGRAYRKGVKIAFGTDAGVFPHGLNYLEFGYLARAGMPNAAILRSASYEAAKLLRMDDQIGAIESGKFADIIAVDGNPLVRIEAMSAIRFVMYNGKILE